MAMVTLKEILKEARAKKYAVGAFDTLDDMQTEAILSTAEEEGLPVIVMIPNFFHKVNDLKFYFPRMLDRVRRASVPVCLHLDHGNSYDCVMKAIHGGCSSVMFDGSALPMDENIAITKEIVKVAHACGVSVEAEIGCVASPEGSLEGNEADPSLYTKPEEAVRFVAETAVDALAVAVGTVHGVYKGTPKIDVDRLDAIRAAVDTPLVLHGSSGLPDAEMRAAIAHGICKINYFTQLSLAGTAGIRRVLEKAGDKRVNYIDLHDAAFEASKACVREQMKLFGTQPLSTSESL